jgi:hypothetical protein
MNTHIRTSAAKRALVTMLAAVAFAFAACAAETDATEVSPAATDTKGWVFSPYPHRAGEEPSPSHADEEVRTPPTTGGDPTVPAKRPGIFL